MVQLWYRPGGYLNSGKVVWHGKRVKMYFSISLAIELNNLLSALQQSKWNRWHLLPSVSSPQNGQRYFIKEVLFLKSIGLRTSSKDRGRSSSGLSWTEMKVTTIWTSLSTREWKSQWVCGNFAPTVYPQSQSLGTTFIFSLTPWLTEMIVFDMLYHARHAVWSPGAVRTFKERHDLQVSLFMIG